MDAIMGTLAALAFVICIILVIYWLMRQMPNHRFSTGRYLKVVDRAMLSNDQSLAIVEIEGQFYFIGVSSHGITLLEKLEGDFQVAPPMESVFGQILTKAKKD